MVHKSKMKTPMVHESKMKMIFHTKLIVCREIWEDDSANVQSKKARTYQQLTVAPARRSKRAFREKASLSAVPAHSGGSLLDALVAASWMLFFTGEKHNHLSQMDLGFRV